MESKSTIDTCKAIVSGQISSAPVDSFLNTWLNNFITGFILGIITGFLGNLLFDIYKRRKNGNKPFINSTVANGVIRFEGQMLNSQTSQQTLTKLIKNV